MKTQFKLNNRKFLSLIIEDYRDYVAVKQLEGLHSKDYDLIVINKRKIPKLIKLLNKLYARTFV